MASLIEELRRREAAARQEADELRGEIARLNERLARAEERLSRLEITAPAAPFAPASSTSAGMTVAGVAKTTMSGVSGNFAMEV